MTEVLEVGHPRDLPHARLLQVVERGRAALQVVVARQLPVLGRRRQELVKDVVRALPLVGVDNPVGFGTCESPPPRAPPRPGAALTLTSPGGTSGSAPP